MDFKVDIRMGIDTAAARAEVENFRRAAGENVSMRMEAATETARAEVDALRREASRNASMRIDADTAAARAEIEALRREAGRGSTITPSINGSGAKSAASKLSSDLKSVLTLQAKVVGVVGAAGVVADLLAIAGAAAKASHALALLPAVGFGGLAGLGSVAVGARGITGAFKAATEQSNNSTGNANDAIDKANAVAEAQYGVEQADRAATAAQKDLTNSYKDAGRELRDLNDQLEDQKLSTEDASISVAEAAKNLAKVQHDPSADAETRHRADLSYRQAVQRLKEQQEKTSDLSQDTAEANAKGIEGSDKVTAAKEKVLSATHDQVKAEQDLAKAIREQSLGSSSEQALAKAMAKLSPNAKELVNDIRALGPAWNDAQQTSQDALTNGLGASITTLVKQQLPGLKTGMVGINTAINSGLRATLASLSSETNKADFKTSLANVALGFQNAAKGAAPLTDALTKLITIGTDFLPKMGENFARFATDFNNRVQVGAATGSLKTWIQEGIDAGKTFFGILKDAGSIVASVFRAADADGVSKSFRQASQDFASFLKGAEGQDKLRAFFAEARADLDRIKPILADLPALLSGVYQGFQVWSGIATPFLKVAADLLSAHPALVRDAVVAYLAFKTLSPVFSGLRSQIQDTNSALSTWRRTSDTVNGALTSAFTALRTGATSAFTTLGTGASTLFTALRTDATGAFNTFRSGVAGVVSASGGVANVAGVGSVALGRFGSAVQQLGTHIPVVARMQQTFLDTAATATTFSRTAGALAATGLTPAANGIRTAAQALGNAGSGLLSALGGPWGIAITGATTAFLAYKSDADQTRRVQEELANAVVKGAKAQDTFRASLEASSGALTTQAKEAASSLTTANLASITDVAKSGHSGWSSFWHSLASDGHADFIKSNNEKYDSIQRAIDQNSTLQKVLRDQKLEVSDLGGIVANGGESYTNLINALKNTGAAGSDVVAALEKTRDELTHAGQLARDTTPGFSSLTDAVKTLSDASASGADRLSALKTALDVLSGKSLDAQDALARYNDQVRQTVDLTKNWDASQGTGQQLLDGNKIDTGTANGRKLYDTLKAIRDATADAALAGNDLDPILAKNQTQFEDLARATGLDVQTIKDLATGIGYLPNDIKILAHLQGASDVTQQLTVINEELKTHKDGVTIPVKALTKEARDELDRLKLVEPVPGKPDEIHVVAYTADALAKLQELADKKLPDKTQKINIDWKLADNASPVAVLLHQTLADQGVLKPSVPANATGGMLPTTGPGTEKRDGILAVTGAGVPVARVDGGEWVINRQSSQKYGTELAQINAGTFRQLPGHEDGGVIGGDNNKTDDQTGKTAQADTNKATTTSHVSDLISYAQSINGTPYGGDFDCSGTQSKLANKAVGREPDSGRMATSNEGEFLSALGFKDGVGNSSTFRIGWVNNPNMAAGGHTAGTLPNGVNVESGGATSKVMYGGQAIGASDNMFTNRSYLVMDAAGGSGAYVPGQSTPGSTVYNTNTSTVTNPQAALPGKKSDTQISIEEDKAAVDSANSERNAVYANPASTDADKHAADLKYQKAQNTLESAQKKDDNSSLSLKGIFSKAAGYFADAILSGLGLENSIFSENNVYNKAINSVVDHYKDANGTGGYSYTPQNLPTVVTTSTPQSDAPVSDPALTDQVPAADTTTVGKVAHAAAVEAWRPTFKSVLAALGKPDSWLEPGLSQMETESSGNKNAINDHDSDGKGGTQTVKGLMQMLDSTYATYRSAQFGGGIFDGASNIAASINYTAARYGDATTVWGQGHGYANGGWIPGTGGGRGDGTKVWASPDEFIVNAYDATRNGDALEAINQGRWSPVNIDPSQLINRGDSAANGGGTQFITHINEPRVADVRDLADLVERQAHIKSMGQLAAVR
ncbi:hypothetical protein ACQP1O_43250 (plasmid) [Nocardia sp. CA-151230]|uniref:hypothetical protein n=1 Tax=Nocardia sp. CA-151230 TaxID=3239982 RepID=UPI003D94C4DD